MKLGSRARLWDGETKHPGGCPRGRNDCAGLARLSSGGYASFMCCGHTTGAPVPSDTHRLCIYSSHDNSPIDVMVNLDTRDVIDVISVLSAKLSTEATCGLFAPIVDYDGRAPTEREGGGKP